MTAAAGSATLPHVVSGDKNPSPRKRGGGSKRIDWDAARQFFLDLGPERTLAEVSRRFGVSDVSVGKHSRANGWTEAAAEFDRKVREELEKRAVRTRAQRVVKALSIIDRTLDRYDATIDEAEVKLSDFPALIKVAELLEGEATDRVSIGEVQEVIRTVFLVAGRYVPKERRDDFKRDLEQTLGGLQEAAAA